MSALADLSDLVNRLTGGNSGTPEHPFVYFDNRVASAAAAATVAGRYTSLWQYNKAASTRGSAPGAVAAPTEATTGALPFTDPGGGRQKWLLGCSALSSAIGSFILYDRLLHISGLDGTNTGAQTVGGTLTRNTGGVGNQIWVEIYTQIGTSGTTIAASYTDNDGNSGQTSQAASIGGTGLREAQRIIPIPLADGDIGVRAVASVTLAGSTGTAGDFGITVARPIAMLTIPLGGIMSTIDFLTNIPALPELVANSCLALAWMAQGTGAPQGMVHYQMVEA